LLLKKPSKRTLSPLSLSIRKWIRIRIFCILGVVTVRRPGVRRNTVSVIMRVLGVPGSVGVPTVLTKKSN